MCPSLCSLIQRAGRAARAPNTEAIFIYMVEDWVDGVDVDQESAAYIADPDTPVRPVTKGKGKDKQWVGMASVTFAKSTSCLHVELLNYLGDKSGEHGGNGYSWSVSKRSADTTYTGYSTRWCCDRHGEDIDFASFGLGDFWDGQQPRQYEFVYVRFGSGGRGS